MGGRTDLAERQLVFQKEVRVKRLTKNQRSNTTIKFFAVHVITLKANYFLLACQIVAKDFIISVLHQFFIKWQCIVVIILPQENII